MKNYYIRRAFENFITDVILCKDCKCDVCDKCLSAEFALWENFGDCTNLSKDHCYIFPRWQPSTTNRIGMSCCKEYTGFYEIQVSCARDKRGARSLDELTDCIMSEFECLKRLEYEDDNAVYAIQLTQAVSRSPAFTNGDRYEATITIPYTTLGGCC